MIMLSQIEKDVLEAIMLGKKNVGEIAKYCGIPRMTVESVLSRLMEEEYINDKLEPTKKAYDELKLIDPKHPPSYYGENIKKLLKVILDLFIVVILIWLIWSIFIILRG